MPQPDSPQLQRIRALASGTHEVLGELETDGRGAPLILARNRSSDALDGLVLEADGASVRVHAVLGETVRVPGSACPECQTPLPELERFCFQCGADLSAYFGSTSPELTRVLHALATATAERFVILGRQHTADGDGMVFYARETESGRLVALRVRKAQAGDQTAAEYVVAQAPLVGRGVMPVPSAPAPVPVSPPTPVVHAPPVAAYDPPPAAPWSEPHAVQAPAPPAAPPTVAPSVTSRRSARGPLIGGAVVIVLASIGYLASRPGGDPAGTAAMPPAVAPVADSLPAVAPAPAADTASVAASTPSTPTPASGTPSGPRSSVADSGTLQLFALPPNARVTVDGRSYKARTIALKTGAHTLEIAADGFEPLSQSVTIAAGRGLRVAPTLVAIAKRAPGGDAPENKPAPKPTCRSATRESRWSAALELCTADANGGDVAAMVNLARQYSKGLGVPANGEQAYSWYAKAAEKGDAEAQTFIAYALRDGQHVKRDEKESVRWFKTAAEAGNSAAEFEYGVALDRGKGVKKDQAAAREWYRKAAAAGLAEAAFRLGRLHEDGDGGPRSDEQAAVAYERAAALGHAEGALKIARWYRDGRGVGKSPEKALQWFKKAAELGNEDAAKEAAKLEKGKH